MSQQIGELVSKQAVDALVDELARAISDERCCMSRGRATSTIMQDILDLPPKDRSVQDFVDKCRECGKQKTGHWIDDKCSVCGKGIEDLIDSREWYRNEEPNFCPFCGIRVVEGEEE